MGKVSLGDGRDVQDKHESNGQRRRMLSFSSLDKCTTAGFMLHAVNVVNSLLVLRCEWDLVCYSGHLLQRPGNRCCLYFPSLMLDSIGRCSRVKNNVPKKLGALFWICVYVCSSVLCLWLSPCLSLFLSVLRVFVVQVQAGWLHGELLGDSAHWEHLPQPRQSPSLLGLLRKAHRSVLPGLWVALWWSERECVCLRAKKTGVWNGGRQSHNNFLKFQLHGETKSDG